MKKPDITKILEAVADGTLSVKEATKQLGQNQAQNIGFADVDLGRTQRTGYPETIFGSGKSANQIVGIINVLKEQEPCVLCTRIGKSKAAKIVKAIPAVHYFEEAKCLVVGQMPKPITRGSIAIVTAGTSDIPVAEEAAVTAEVFGNRVERVFDVGVAGIQRLFAKLDVIRQANVIIVAAGMDGALASVVGGLVSQSVIALPTSIGYGSNFHGVSALLTMLNSCAEGVSVVNIDNGFGAAYCASVINRNN